MVTVSASLTWASMPSASRRFRASSASAAGRNEPTGTQESFMTGPKISSRSRGEPPDEEPHADRNQHAQEDQPPQLDAERPAADEGHGGVGSRLLPVRQQFLHRPGRQQQDAARLA